MRQSESVACPRACRRASNGASPQPAGGRLPCLYRHWGHAVFKRTGEHLRCSCSVNARQQFPIMPARNGRRHFTLKHGDARVCDHAQLVRRCQRGLHFTTAPVFLSVQCPLAPPALLFRRSRRHASRCDCHPDGLRDGPMSSTVARSTFTRSRVLWEATCVGGSVYQLRLNPCVPCDSSKPIRRSSCAMHAAANVVCACRHKWSTAT